MERIEEFERRVNRIETVERILGNRQQKVYKHRSNPMVDLSDEDFKSKYRLSKTTVEYVLGIIGHKLEGDKRGGKIPPVLQLLACLRYWGRGEIQDDCSDIHGISQPTISIMAKKVATAIAEEANKFIYLPRNLQEEEVVISEFRNNLNFPLVVGAIDCTHIRLKKMGGENGQYFINRKHYYSINVQVVCDANLKITNIVARWKGATHDARIFRESNVKERFENGEFRGRLLGDSGYACTPYLFTPLLNPRTRKEENYNRAHIRARNVVERCFGVWKQRFRCLLRGMYCSYETTKTTIVALAVLHNIAIDAREGIMMDDENASSINENGQLSEVSSSAMLGPTTATNMGSAARRAFIEEHF